MKNSKKLVTIVCTWSIIFLTLITGCSLDSSVVKKNVENVIISDITQSSKVVSEDNEIFSEELGKIQVYFINVGQADSALIVTPNKDAILIDSGEKGDADTIISQIRATGVEDLDLVIATHPHADHIGGMQEVIETFEAREIVMSSHIATSKTFENLLDSIDNQGKGITQAKVGMSRNIDGVQVEVLAVDTIADDSNNSSILLRVEYGEVSLLFTGDLEEQAEKIILRQVNHEDLNADILKVGHHGSETSTSDEFLEVINPKVAVISVGKDNKYNHPSLKVIDKLMKKGITFYRTDEDNTIELEIDGVDIVTILAGHVETITYKAFPINERSLLMRESIGSTPVSRDVNIAEVQLVEQVYITENSLLYHKNGCWLLNGSTKTIAVNEADEQGYSPCSGCFN